MARTRRMLARGAAYEPVLYARRGCTAHRQRVRFIKFAQKNFVGEDFLDVNAQAIRRVGR